MAPFQCLGDFGEAGGDIARDLGGFAGGVECVWFVPDGDEAILDFLIQQIIHVDAVGLAIWEMGVVFALAGEVRIDFHDIADIDNDEEGRVAVINGKGAGVIFRLLARGEHDLIPAFAAVVSGGFMAQQVWLVFGLLYPAQRLLGFQHEAIALVAINEASRFGAVGVFELHITLVDIIVERGIGLCHHRGLQTQSSAEAGHENLAIAAF